MIKKEDVFIKEYTDCQLRLGLLKWLMVFILPSGRTQDAATILDNFESSLYYKDAEGALINRCFKQAEKLGISPHLNIKRESLVHDNINSKSRKLFRDVGGKKSTQDILNWAVSFGFLMKPSVRSGYPITKDGYFFKKLVDGDDQLINNIQKSVENPFILKPIERRYLFIQEISKDWVMLPFLVRLSENFSESQSFTRADKIGKKTVRLLIQSFEDVYKALNIERRSKDTKAICNHIWRLENSIGEEGVSTISMASRIDAHKKKISKKAVKTKTFKTAKHRLTPRLEHFTEYGFLRDAAVTNNSPKKDTGNYLWRISLQGYAAAEFIRKMSPNKVYEDTNILPIIDDFILNNAAKFFHETEGLDARFLNLNEKDDQNILLKHFFWTYKRCRMGHGYTPFYTLGIGTVLHALEENYIVELSDIFNFFKKVVPTIKELNESVKIAGGTTINKMHIRIVESFFNEVFS